MAREIAEGYFTVTERAFQRMSRADLDRIAFEIDRMLRDVRGQQPDLEDINAIKQRNRKIQRINSALMILRAYRLKRKL
jgi:hypothetical protein